MKLVQEDENQYILEIELTTNCNYRCYYCTPNLYAGKTQLDYKDILWYVDKLIENDNTKIYNIRLLGGEPTFHPQIDIILEELYNRKIVNVHFVTNGSRPVTWWENAQKFLAGCIFSIHQQYAKPQHIINVCNVFDDHKPLEILAMMDPNNWDPALNLATELYTGLKDKNNCRIVKKIIDDRNNITDGIYTDEQKKFLLNWNDSFPRKRKHNRSKISSTLFLKEGKDKIKYRIMDAKLTNKDVFKGWLCNAGIDGSIIDAKGNVHKSACFRHKKGMGNIKIKNVNFPSTGIICDKNKCNCLTDLQFRKFNDSFVELPHLSLTEEERAELYQIQSSLNYIAYDKPKGVHDGNYISKNPKLPSWVYDKFKNIIKYSKSMLFLKNKWTTMHTDLNRKSSLTIPLNIVTPTNFYETYTSQQPIAKLFHNGSTFLQNNEIIHQVANPSENWRYFFQINFREPFIESKKWMTVN